MNRNHFKALAVTTLLFSAFSINTNALASDKLLILEAGASYSHAFYKSSVTFPESVTPVTPAGYSIDPKDFYPENFWGGYIGASLFLSEWLINTRYDMYGSETRTNGAAATKISIAPARYSFTVDKVGGCITDFSYGLGAGAVIETINKGEADIILADDNPLSESIQGRTRIDPMVEGFIMYQFANHVGLKFNVAYQIAVNDNIGRGDLNVNLGLNYALPI